MDSNTTLHKQHSAKIKLVAWRTRVRLSQDRVALILGLSSRSDLSRWETGKAIPSTIFAARIEALTNGAIAASDWAGAAGELPNGLPESLRSAA